MDKIIIAAVVAVVVLIVTGFISLDTWLTNRQVAGEVAQASPKNDKNDKRSYARADPRPDETPLPKDSLKNYMTAADTPRAVYVDKLNVAARTIPLGVEPDGKIAAPQSVYDAGWYQGSVKPGETGAVVVDGHASGASKLGAFGKLAELNTGDVITLQTGNMKKFKYKVVKKEIVEASKVNMQKVMLPHGNALEAANFITCAGDWTKDNSTMTKRVVIYTERV